MLIDAANDAPTLLDLIGTAGLDTVVTTHRHGDHWQALSDVVEATGATLAGPRRRRRRDPGGDRHAAADGDTVAVGDCTLEVIHLVGHTPGSIALLYQDPDGIAHLWTGDSLFPGGPGQHHEPGGLHVPDGRSSSASCSTGSRDDTWFYPGHGEDSTLGAERPQLAEWRARGW